MAVVLEEKLALAVVMAVVLEEKPALAIVMAEVPEARARLPRSPGLASTLEIMVPSGITLTGRMLPTVREAIK